MISMKVHGMAWHACDGCVSRVKRAVSALDPSAHIQIDLNSGQVDVQSNRPAAEIVNVIKTLGYDVTDVNEKI